MSLTGDGNDMAIVNTDTSSTSSGATYPVVIGGRQQNPDLQSFNGFVDGVRIYDHSLSESEVRALVSIAPVLAPDIESFRINTGGVATIEWKHTGLEYTVECASNLLSPDWLPVKDGTVWPIVSNCWSCSQPQLTGPHAQSRLYYRVKKEPATPRAPEGMVLIPAGSFQMGENFGEGQSGELPLHTLSVSAFYMDRHEVTKILWDDVANWGSAHGYGLCDMAGNVWERCWDWYGGSYYGMSPGSDPRGPASGWSRVLRGSAWGDCAVSCRVADRYEGYPGASFYMVGFRAVLAVGQ